MRDATAGTLPRFAIWENVAGALSSNKGDDFLAVLDAFAEIGAVDVAWRLVDAQFFGVPQRRRRVFVVADFGGECAGAVHVEPAGMRWHPASGGTAGEAVAGSFGVSIAGTLGSSSGGFRTTDLDGIGAYVPATAGTLAAGAHPGSYNGQDAYNDLLIPYPIQDCRDMDKVQNGLGVGGPHDPMYTLDRVAQHGAAFVKAKRASSPDDDESWRPDGPAPTLNQFDNNSDTRATVLAMLNFQGSKGNSITNDGEVSFSLNAMHGHDVHAIAVKEDAVTPTAVRRLTPRECERLMGWPDDHTRWRADGTEQADSQRYRQCGNGVAAPVAAWLAWNLKIALQTESETQ
jgi:DNA (cytosine-5)-methyltransferase 1